MGTNNEEDVDMKLKYDSGIYWFLPGFYDYREIVLCIREQREDLIL